MALSQGKEDETEEVNPSSAVSTAEHQCFFQDKMHAQEKAEHHGPHLKEQKGRGATRRLE